MLKTFVKFLVLVVALGVLAGSALATDGAIRPTMTMTKAQRL